MMGISVVGSGVYLFLPMRLGWWWVIAGPGVVVAGVLLGGFVIQMTAFAVEWVVISAWRCKSCGGRKFGGGHGPGGFGL
jgi:hypothetical protein